MDKNDISFIKDQNHWPQWPVLPVKKRDKQVTIGIIHCSSLTTVAVGLNLFGGWGQPEWDEAEKKVYSTVEELVADGWVVD